MDSLVVQTTKEPLQIILVDDGSTDNSLEIARSYASKDKRIEIYCQTHAGQSVARNLGMQQAKGEFITFVDADDRLAPDWCERHLKAIGNADYVQSGFRRTKDKEENGWWVGRRHIYRHRFQPYSIRMRLYRREAIAHLHFEEGLIYADVLFSIDLWLSGAQCKMLKYTGYLYTRNPNSVTARLQIDQQHRVLQALRDRRKGQTWRHRQIINYTILRLTVRFMQL